MRFWLGILMIVGIFVGLFVYMAVSSGIRIAMESFLVTAAIAVWIAVACWFLS